MLFYSLGTAQIHYKLVHGTKPLSACLHVAMP